LASCEYLVAIELDDREREARIDLAAPLQLTELEQLYSTQIGTSEQVEWDEKSGAVLATRTRRYGALVLESRALQSVPPELAHSAMLLGIRQLGLAALPWDEETRNLQARLEFVRQLDRPHDGAWPASDDATLLSTLEGWLPAWIEGMARKEHLARLPLAEALLARLNPAQRRELEQLAPRDVTVPTGSRIRINYTDEGGPSAAVRLQEVFGLATTPRIGGGRIPIAFKLLSPARRPVQITRDLAGFWNSSYREVRKEMRGRYPKHHWPEDPFAATPTRGTRRR
jgi:ATP-dependent helicase HrpB